MVGVERRWNHRLCVRASVEPPSRLFPIVFLCSRCCRFFHRHHLNLHLQNLISNISSYRWNLKRATIEVSSELPPTVLRPQAGLHVSNICEKSRTTNHRPHFPSILLANHHLFGHNGSSARFQDLGLSQLVVLIPDFVFDRVLFEYMLPFFRRRWVLALSDSPTFTTLRQPSWFMTSQTLSLSNINTIPTSTCL